MTTRFLGQFLLEEAAISNEQLRTAVALQERKADGRIAARSRHFGLLTQDEIDRILLLRESSSQPFVDLAVAEGLLTSEGVQMLAAALMMDDHTTLGDALVRTGALSPEQLVQYLEACSRDAYASVEPLSSLLEDHPRSDVLQTITNVMTKALTRTLSEVVTASGCHSDLAAMTPNDYTLYQPYTGDFEGEMYLNLSGTLLLRTARGLMNEHAESFNNTVADGAGEFLNIVNGNACVQLSTMGRKVGLVSPRCFRHQPNHFDRYARLFDLREGAAPVAHTSIVTLTHPSESLELCFVDRNAL